MTPRHSPRALRSLTTPIGPPHRCGSFTTGLAVRRQRLCRRRSIRKVRSFDSFSVNQLVVWRVPLTLSEVCCRSGDNSETATPDNWSCILVTNCRIVKKQTSCRRSRNSSWTIVLTRGRGRPRTAPTRDQSPPRRKLFRSIAALPTEEGRGDKNEQALRTHEGGRRIDVSADPESGQGMVPMWSS